MDELIIKTYENEFLAIWLFKLDLKLQVQVQNLIEYFNGRMGTKIPLNLLRRNGFNLRFFASVPNLIFCSIFFFALYAIFKLF
jgi:hypothetical protein